jgi:hypothetical protein
MPIPSSIAEDWLARHQRISEYLESIETDPARLSHFRKGLSFVAGHILAQTDLDTWDEMKRTAFDLAALGKVTEQVHGWRSEQTPNTPVFWAYEILAISFECAAANNPIAVEHEHFVDEVITKAFQDFPLPRPKPPSKVRRIFDPMSATDEKNNRERKHNIEKKEKYTIRKGSLLDTALNGDDTDADAGVIAVKMTKVFAELDGASQNAKDNWNIIRNWLEMDIGEELGPDEQHRIKKAYKAYLAMGIAPSVKLDPVFKEASKQYKTAGYDLETNKPPAEILQAFGRMLATEKEIEKKRAPNNMMSWKQKALDDWGVFASLLIVIGLVIWVGSL